MLRILGTAAVTALALLAVICVCEGAGNVAESGNHGFTDVKHAGPHHAGHRMLEMRAGRVNSRTFPAFHADAHHHVARRTVFEVPAGHKEHPQQYLVQFSGVVTPRMRAELLSVLGDAARLQYVPRNAFHFVATPEQASAVGALPSVAWVGFYRPQLRVHPLVMHELTGDEAHLTAHQRTVQAEPLATEVAGKAPFSMGKVADAPKSASVEAETEAETEPKSEKLVVGGLVDGVAVEMPMKKYATPVDAAARSFAGNEDAETAAPRKYVVLLSRASPVNVATFAEQVGSLVSQSACSAAKVSATARYKVTLEIPSTCDASAAVDAVQAAASHPMAHWVEQHPVFEKQNHESNWVTQSFMLDSTPVWDMGLDGSGEVIAFADSGLDMSSCFFHDASVGTPYDTVNTAHRKVVQYIPLDNTIQDYKEDESEGHGTHVGGSIGGKAVKDSAPSEVTFAEAYNGAAPGCKLAHFDFGLNDGSLGNIPDLETDLFPYAAQASAHIHSNSWGSSQYGEYTTSSQETDAYVHAHPEMLVLYAAGNSGTNGLVSVIPPSTSKNAMSIGAELNAYQASAEAVSLQWGQFTVGSSYLFALRMPYSARGTGTTLNAALATVSNPCAPLSGVSGKIVVFGYTSACSGPDMALNVQNAGGLMAVIVNGEDSFGVVPGNSGDVTIQVVLVPSSTGNTLINEVPNSVPFENRNTPDYSSDSDYSRNNLAEFSSRGPTNDLRIKPDLIAPGAQVISAYSNFDSSTVQCGRDAIVPMQGTSMATPIMAGNAALVRQYLADGNYGSSAMNNPSAALIKAMLIHSGQELSGMVDLDGSGDWVSFSSIADHERRMYEGFGRVQLDKVLETPAADHTLWLEDKTTASISTGSADHYCFSVDVDQPLRATLVWTDPEADPSSLTTLVNDLDLIVNVGSNTYLGNQLDPTKASSGTTFALADALNNVERVDVPASGLGGSTVTVAVAGYNVPQGSSSYSLVVTGNITQLASGACSLSCPSDCSGRGTCTAGICTCNADAAGSDCSVDTTTVTVGNDVSVTVPFNAVAFYKVVPDASRNLDLKIAVSFSSSQGDIVFFGRADEPPRGAGDATDAYVAVAPDGGDMYVLKENFPSSGGAYYFAIQGSNGFADPYSTSPATSQITMSMSYQNRPSSAGHALGASSLVTLAAVVLALLALVLN